MSIPDHSEPPVFAPESATREAVKCDWPWWWSTDQERYHGPCSSRTDAISEALCEDNFGSVHIMQATHGTLSCDIFDGSEIADAFDNANEEASDGEGDPLSTQIPDEAWAKIAKSVEAQVKVAVYANGVSAWGFSEQTKGEWVELSNPHLAALPPEVRQLFVEAALGFANGWSGHYIDEIVGRLKVIAAPIQTASTPDDGDVKSSAKAGSGMNNPLSQAQGADQ